MMRTQSIGLFLLTTFLSSALWALPPFSATLPKAVYADTEVVTNVPFRAALDASGRFSVTLACRATPSNNVEVAFGPDRNGNGVLDADEAERTVGWDCGAWFTRGGADDESVLCTTTNTSDGVHSLTWTVKIGRDGTPSRFQASADGESVFLGIPTASVYSPSWNVMRLVRRGLGEMDEWFEVAVLPDATVIRIR